jgi:acyl carrier protein
MERLFESIKEVFPEFRAETYGEDMTLNQIPDWDSMNSINLQMQVEERYGVELDSDAPLTGANTIHEFFEYIQHLLK